MNANDALAALRDLAHKKEIHSGGGDLCFSFASVDDFVNIIITATRCEVRGDLWLVQGLDIVGCDATITVRLLGSCAVVETFFPGVSP